MRYLVLCLLLAACGSVADVHLRDPQSGKTVTCEGGSGLSEIRTHAKITEQRGCVSDYQRQGYERVP